MKFSNVLKRTWSTVFSKLSHKMRDTTATPKLQSNSSSSAEVEMPVSFVVYSGAHTADAFGPLPFSPVYRSIDGESLPALSSSPSSSSSTSSILLSPNAGLFNMNQYDFGFDVWFAGPRGIIDPICVPCLLVPSWFELVVLLASEAQREEEDVAFFNGNYNKVISNEEDYEAWLEWCKENERFTNTDLWLV